MNFKKILPLLLAASLVTAHVHAEDGFNFIGGDAQAEKIAKAPREKNDGHWLENQAKGFAAGAAAGAVNTVLLGAAAMNPLVAAPMMTVIGQKITEDRFSKINAFYSGTVIRGKVSKIVTDPAQNDFGWPAGALLNGGVKVIPEKFFGFSLKTFPSNVANRFDVLHFDVDGPDGTTIFALAPKGSDFGKGDIIDIKYPVGIFALNTKVFDNLHFDFNKHMPRVVNVYCKHDQPCQNDFESSLGVLYRHTDKEFPPSQYLIDPAIIAADQSKMRKEEEERKSASNSGGFSFM